MMVVAEGHVTSKAAGYYHCFIIYQNHFTSKGPSLVLQLLPAGPPVEPAMDPPPITPPANQIKAIAKYPANH